MFIPAALRRSIASGGGASIQSICPDSSAATRVDASGIGNSTTRSWLGMRAWSQ